MKKILLLVLITLSIFSITNAQYYWSQKANVGGMNRQKAVGFSVSHKGYIGTGKSLETNVTLRDFWCYDPISNSWTQVADFVSARYAASCFVINDTAYVGCGSETLSLFHFVRDFWKYNQTTNTWIQIADFIGNPRYDAPAFSIGNMGYVGTGYDQVTPFYSDFYEYNSITNTWAQKADFPGGARQAGVGFAIGSFGYMGTGWSNASSSDFYKYDPSIDSWTQIADLPTICNSSTCFVLNNLGYVGTGSMTYPSINLFAHYWFYTPASNAWTAIADCGPMARYNAVAFSIDNAGYCGTGGFQDFTTHDTVDFWKYAPVSSEGVTTISNVISNLFVYPNPASTGQFTIHCSSKQDKSIELKVLNIEGKVVALLNKKVVVGINEFPLDLSMVAKGIYFVELCSNNEKRIQKFILN